MTMMMIVAGLVLGLLVFLMVRRKWNRAEKMLKLEGVELLCPRCAKTFKASEGWKRTGLRGDFVSCTLCGETSIWNLNAKPPIVKRRGRA